MDLYLVRHAFAGKRDPARWPDDAQRPMTPEGARRFRQAARGIGRVAPKVEAVLSSPYARAWETAKILAAEAGWPAPIRCDALAGARGYSEVMKVLSRKTAGGAIALVGHEPNLGLLAAHLLLGDAARAILELEKGGWPACGSLAGPARPRPSFAGSFPRGSCDGWPRRLLKKARHPPRCLGGRGWAAAYGLSSREPLNRQGGWRGVSST
jgi:phosphohistidine phosphatase